MINRRLAVVSGLAILSTVTFAPKAGAAPIEEVVPFEGSINSVCSFSATVGGTLAQPGFDPNADWIEASNGTGIGNTGEAGKTTVNCTAGGTLSVTAPVQILAPAGFVSPTNHVVVYDGANYTSAGTPLNGGWTKPTTPLTLPVGDVILNVGMVAGQESVTGSLPAGTYKYEVTLTATPN